MAISSGVRGILGLAFLSLSALGGYNMRYLPFKLGMPVNFDSVLANRHLNIPFQHITIPQKYTRIGPLDELLAMLVSAFSHGPLRLLEDVYWQQLHFLFQFLPVIAVFTVEAYRVRNKGAIISYTTLWALFYQTIAGAVIIPLMQICYLFTSNRPGYLRTGRAVPVHEAQAIAPALLIGYIVPTALLFIPGYSSQTVLYFIAIWQFTPAYVNVLIGNFSRTIKAFSASSKQPINATADVGYLKGVYLLCLVTSFVSHVVTIVGVMSGNPDEVSLSSVFIPSQSRLMKSTGLDLHYMFQWDYAVIAIASLVWALYAIIEINSEQSALGIQSDAGRIAALIVLHTMLIGPGGALAAVWWWRENALIEMEQKVKSKAK